MTIEHETPAVEPALEFVTVSPDAPDADITVSELIELTPLPPSVDEVLEWEPDPFKKLSLANYYETLDDAGRLALAEALALSCGNAPPVNEVLTEADKVMDLAKRSQMTYLRNKAAAESLSHFARLAAMQDRLLKGLGNDDTLIKARLGETLDQVRTLNEQVSTLATAIYTMSGLVGLTAHKEVEDLPIDLKALTSICLTIGHGAKPWAATYQVATEREEAHKVAVATYEAEIKRLKSAMDEYRNIVRLRDEAEEKSIVRSSQTYYLMNRSGNYLACRRPIDDNGYTLTRVNLYLTQEVSEAMEFSEITHARTVLDKVLEWVYNYRSVSTKFAEAGVRPDTLFIGQVTIKRVEG